jgi:hypothetical protein
LSNRKTEKVQKSFFRQTPKEATCFRQEPPANHSLNSFSRNRAKLSRKPFQKNAEWAFEKMEFAVLCANDGEQYIPASGICQRGNLKKFKLSAAYGANSCFPRLFALWPPSFSCPFRHLGLETKEKATAPTPHRNDRLPQFFPLVLSAATV